MSYEARKGGIEKRFQELLGSIRSQLEQLRAYVIKSNSDIDRRFKENKASLTRKSHDKSNLVNKMEEENQYKI